jgi:hypothetical protein
VAWAGAEARFAALVAGATALACDPCAAGAAGAACLAAAATIGWDAEGRA